MAIKKPHFQYSSVVLGMDCSRKIRSKSLGLNLPFPLCCCDDNKGQWDKKKWLHALHAALGVSFAVLSFQGEKSDFKISIAMMADF